MKLPFINKKNYIVLKAYTYNSAYLDHVPITLGNKEKPLENKGSETGSSFYGCFGRIMGLGRSATVLMPTNLEFATTADGSVSHSYADLRSKHFSVSYEHAEDPHYVTKDTILTKLELPWQMQETTGALFVMAKHIQNKTMMNIPTGVVSYNNQHSVNVFNLVSKLNHSYEIKAKTPIVSVYPLSEKKLVVEAYHDPSKYDDLVDRAQYRPYWSANAVKMAKVKKCPI